MAQGGTVVFCDLDGTLVLDNSFHVFLAVLWSECPPAQRPALAARLASRLLGAAGGGHAGMKRRVLDWFGRQPALWRREVVVRVVARLRPTLSAPVAARLEALRSRGARVVLATAAPDVYAVDMARLAGAEDCLATRTGGAGFVDLLGEAKAAACRDWLRRAGVQGAGWRIVVLTDHPDDLPLMRMADSVVVQADGPRLDAILAGLPPDLARAADHVDPVCAQSGGGFWLWFDDRPVGPLDRWEVHVVLSKHRHARLFAGTAGWIPVGPGAPLDRAVLRRDCPLPPSSRSRLRIHARRRVQRDWLGIFH